MRKRLRMLGISPRQEYKKGVAPVAIGLFLEDSKVKNHIVPQDDE